MNYCTLQMFSVKMISVDCSDLIKTINVYTKSLCLIGHDHSRSFFQSTAKGNDRFMSEHCRSQFQKRSHCQIAISCCPSVNSLWWQKSPLASLRAVSTSNQFSSLKPKTYHSNDTLQITFSFFRCEKKNHAFCQSMIKMAKNSSC